MITGTAMSTWVLYGVVRTVLGGGPVHVAIFLLLVACIPVAVVFGERLIVTDDVVTMVSPYGRRSVDRARIVGVYPAVNRHGNAVLVLAREEGHERDGGGEGRAERRSWSALAAFRPWLLISRYTVDLPGVFKWKPEHVAEALGVPIVASTIPD